MMLTADGRERTENDWKRILSDAGFKVESISTPNMMSIIETRIA